MREIRQSGSEGGEVEWPSLPLSFGDDWRVGVLANLFPGRDIRTNQHKTEALPTKLDFHNIPFALLSPSQYSSYMPSLSVTDIVVRFDLDLILMYGSRAREQSHPKSDTDIAIRSRRVIPREQELIIARELDAFYPNVEVCDIRKASPLLLGAIAQDAKLVYEGSPALFQEFKIFAFNQYWDFKPYLERLKKANERRIKDL